MDDPRAGPARGFSQFHERVSRTHPISLCVTRPLRTVSEPFTKVVIDVAKYAS
jgi:hypothetical protein